MFRVSVFDLEYVRVCTASVQQVKTLFTRIIIYLIDMTFIGKNTRLICRLLSQSTIFLALVVLTILLYVKEK